MVGSAPARVTTDGNDAYPPALCETLGTKVMHRHSRYLNNRLEQDHRGIKQRYYPMRGFGNVGSAGRFCRAFDELRHHFRCRSRMGQQIRLEDQRRLHRARLVELHLLLMAA